MPGWLLGRGPHIRTRAPSLELLNNLLAISDDLALPVARFDLDFDRDHLIG